MLCECGDSECTYCQDCVDAIKELHARQLDNLLKRYGEQTEKLHAAERNAARWEAYVAFWQRCGHRWSVEQWENFADSMIAKAKADAEFDAKADAKIIAEEQE